MSKRSKKDDTWGADGSSTWKLKSPVKMSSDEDEMKSSRSEVKGFFRALKRCSRT